MKHRLILPLIALLAIICGGCVHEFPEFNNNVNVSLLFHHDTSWTEYDFIIGDRTRTSEDEGWTASYIIKVYPHGKTDSPVYTESFEIKDLTLADFTKTLSMPEGDWDIYVWQDLKNENVKPYYNYDNFAQITYDKPYRGDTDYRQAFEGMTTVSIPATIEEKYIIEGRIDMERPQAKYVFIATDFEKFYNETLTRFGAPAEKSRWEMLSAAQKQEILKGFSVIVRYPWFMPSVYDMFTQRVRDSWTDVSFPAEINPLNGEEAVVALDYVFMNHHDSSAQVQLGLRIPDNSVIGLTGAITIPLKRGQITYVRGNFLTASVGNGLEVDFSFSGDFNIRI